jgi:hypothetical protein
MWRFPAAILAVAALLVAGDLAFAGNPAPNPALIQLPENSWKYLDPKPYTRQSATKRDENAPLKVMTTKEPPFREYTSPIYGDGKIYYFGGGHSGYPGNDMEIFDPIANSWRQCYPPRCPPKDDTTYFSGGSERAYVDPETGACQPYVLHGYARTNYDTSTHRYLCTAMFPTKNERDPETKKWKLAAKAFGLIAFDGRTNAWTWLAAAPNIGAFGLSEFDRDFGGILGFAGREAKLFKDGQWSSVATAPFDLGASGGAPIAWIPDQKAHIVALLGHGGKKERGQLALVRLGEKKFQFIASMPDELQARVAPGTGGFNLAMAYDAVGRKLAVMSINDAFRPDVWLYDVAGERWSKLPASPTAPTLKSRFEPGMGRAPLMYDPVHRVFFLIFRKSDSIETWAFRPPAVK